MKNLTKIIGIIAIIAIVGLTMAACGDDDGAEPPAHLGSTLNFNNEQTYTYNEETGKYDSFNSNVTISSLMGGTGNITGGKFTYNLATPTSLNDSEGFEEVFFLYDLFGEITVSDPDVGMFYIDYFSVSHTTYEYLSKETRSGKVNGNIVTGTIEDITYVYVDRDVTVTGTAFSDFFIICDMEGSAFSISLKEGWNTVCITSVSIMDISTGFSLENMVQHMSVDVKNPASARWTLDTWSSEPLGSISIAPALNILNSQRALKSARLAQ